MSLLVISPGPGLAAFLSRSIVSGSLAGCMVLIGMILVDVLYLALAIIGLSAISAVLGPLFQIVKYIAALYLIWFGYKTVKNAGAPMTISPTMARSHFRDIGLGAIVTLGNPKAILFYSAFLPTVFEVSEIRLGDFLIICVVLTIISFVIYGAYMFLLGRVRHMLETSNFKTRLEQATGAVYIGAGASIALK